MVTSGMSCAFHYELYSTRKPNPLLHDFSRMRMDNESDRPVLYVAVATWIPKCNMYTYTEYVYPSVIFESVQLLEINRST